MTDKEIIELYEKGTKFSKIVKEYQAVEQLEYESAKSYVNKVIINFLSPTRMK